MLQFGVDPFSVHIPKSKKVLVHNVHKGLNDNRRTKTASPKQVREEGVWNSLVNGLFDCSFIAKKEKENSKRKNGGYSAIQIKDHHQKVLAETIIWLVSIWKTLEMRIWKWCWLLYHQGFWIIHKIRENGSKCLWTTSFLIRWVILEKFSRSFKGVNKNIICW